MKIKLNIDTRGYAEKPGKEAGAISNRTRCQKGQKEIEPAELLEKIRAGYTFTPALIGGTLEEIQANKKQGGTLERFWISQQIIVADIDNDHTPPRDPMTWQSEIGNNASKKKSKEPNKYQLTPARALEACKAAGIDPFCMYQTFSYTPWHEKFRVLLVLDEPITDFSTAADLIARFCYLFNAEISKDYQAHEETPEECADASIEPVKLIFGGRADSIIYQSASYTSIAALQALPKAPAETRENAPKTASNSKGENISTSASKATAGTNSIDYDIRNFDMLSYIENTTQSRMHGGHINPCPICSHNDCFSIDPTGAQWYCHSSAHGSGGDIITYLEELHHIEPREAFRMFKQDIMRYTDNNTLTDEERQALERAFDRSGQDPAGDPIQEAPGKDQPGASGSDTAKAAPAISQKIINAYEYLTPKTPEDASAYDADIFELQKYAGRKMHLHPDIDKYLTLYPGLAVLGGQASLGKTTFCVNVAAKLLDAGEHVLYFALEQKPDEIITKAAARYIHDTTKYNVDNIALNSGARDPHIVAALGELADKLRNFTVINCDFETTAADILEICASYMRMHAGVKPIVIIDYLQIIAPPAEFRGAKSEYIDENLKALKKWQKDNGLFVLLVSSFNRANNYEPVSYESFLYTSAIEFTCDYVFGLQLSLLDPDNEDFYIRKGSYGGEYANASYEKKKQVHEAQAQTPKQVQFVSLKNRKGKQLFKANFDYYPAFDYFAPVESKPRHVTPKANR